LAFHPQSHRHGLVAALRSYLPERQGVDIRRSIEEGGLLELRVVQNIEKFSAKLQLYTFGDRSGFSERDIEIR
jgi:hypothetical protein